LFFSFVLEKKNLPKDLQLQSASIYFSFILKKVLSSLGSSLWLKWPNDFYIDDKKIGGTITTATKDLVLCGIGLNLIEVSSDFGKLDINIDIKETLENYFKKLEFEQSWKQIFSEYKIEFKKSENFTATINNNKISLKKAILNEDGSIEINNTRVFSLR
jgi:BirA family biotin operon repressor/biotin-[acetyl-CoA-carboxylase] ligase